ncbi:MAG: hypothetical protein OXU53_01260 [Deltaproteobacteria bacterium]|nr:hypothetical protein [Deltaproteobacteria bacterium]
MNAPVVIRCAGAPRDMGLDQGAALRSQVRRAARAHWTRRAFEWARGQHKCLRRDLLRHFPHQAERMMGLARGAGVGSARLAALLVQTPPGASALARAGAREAGESAAAQAGHQQGAGESGDMERAKAGRGDAGCVEVGCGDAGCVEVGGGAWLDCRLPLHSGRGRGLDDFALRHSAPDNDRASVEITFAWQAPALVGVNADGLAVCALPGAAGAVDSAGGVGAVAGAGGVDGAREAGCAAPALLLAQDCLRLFDQTPSALEWIRSRPAGGRCTLLLADASGRIAGAVVEGERREELHAQNGRIAVSGAAANSLRILADPLGRRLGVQPPGGALVWHQVGT